jgi:hypothetical protein
MQQKTRNINLTIIKTAQHLNAARHFAAKKRAELEKKAQDIWTTEKQTRVK